jgi:hypothetical protein
MLAWIRLNAHPCISRSKNFFTRNANGRWPVTFAFGIIHGFGFAGAPGDHAAHECCPTALTAFDIVVEIGQVASSIVLPGAELLGPARGRRQDQPGKPHSDPCSALIAILGSYWFLTRVLDV